MMSRRCLHDGPAGARGHVISESRRRHDDGCHGDDSSTDDDDDVIVNSSTRAAAVTERHRPNNNCRHHGLHRVSLSLSVSLSVRLLDFYRSTALVISAK